MKNMSRIVWGVCFLFIVGFEAFAADVVNCSFGIADYFDTNHDGTGALYGNYTTITAPVTDVNNAVWTGTLIAYNNYAGTNGEVILDEPPASGERYIQVAPDAASIPTSPTVGILSFKYRGGATSGTGTDWYFRGYNTETTNWDTFYANEAMDNVSAVSVLKVYIEDLSKYDKYRFVVVDNAGTAEKDVHIDEVVISNTSAKHAFVACGFEPVDGFPESADSSAVSSSTVDNLGNTWNFLGAEYWDGYGAPTNGDFRSQHIQFYDSAASVRVGDYWEVTVNPSSIPSILVSGDLFIETAIGTSSNIDFDIEGYNGSSWQNITTVSGWTANANITATITDLSVFAKYRMIITAVTDSTSRIHVNDILISTTNNLTPVLGLEFSQVGNVLSWTVEDESTVAKYVVKDSASGEVIEELLAGAGSYSVELEEGSEVVVHVVDKSGYTQNFYPSSTVGKSVSINLHEGWNLLSVPGYGLDVDTLKTFAEGQLWRWDGISYVKMHSADSGIGFWMYVLEPRELLLNVTKGDSLLVLNEGWTLAGPSENIKAPESILIYNWDKSYEQILNEPDILVQGRGYWFYSEEAKIIILE